MNNSTLETNNITKGDKMKPDHQEQNTNHMAIDAANNTNTGILNIFGILIIVRHQYIHNIYCIMHCFYFTQLATVLAW